MKELGYEKSPKRSWVFAFVNAEAVLASIASELSYVDAKSRVLDPTFCLFVFKSLVVNSECKPKF